MRTLLPVVLLGVAAAGVPAAAAPGPLPPELQMEGSETIASPPDDRIQDARWCRLCHQAERFERSAWRTTAHHEQTCTDCHTGYHFNPHEPVTLGAAADADEGSTPAARRAAARERCRECHGEELPTSGHIEHGPGTEGAVTPQCHDCHGDPHTIVTEASLAAPERRRRMNGRCATCHGDEEKMKAVGLTTHSVESYAHSVHARLLDLGSDETPGCVDCHQSHTLRDFEADGVAACEQCHEHATAAFVTLGDHRPYTREERPVSFFTLKFFAWLTFLSVFALAMHVLLDVFSVVRRALFGGKAETPSDRAGGGEA
ncbi:MAG: cytochrome c3 family protein [Myxococcales bacterium]|nr:cytochrome c3 family protein [Myxococcales bacterium]MCB9536850.1 cytochrome c3 family protein [Myxococcales bacterium]